MKGLELSKKYYEQVALPMLQEQFGEHINRIAVGLVGEGSECLGFDDEISQDHDFGPGFCMWLDKSDYDKIGKELASAYSNLPREFEGFKARNDTAQAGQRVGVFEIHDFYRMFVGDNQPPKSNIAWMQLPEDKLATVTNGEVFTDELGEFSKIRDALKAYYPEPVRIKKIAARVAIMAQSGQYNYARCMRRGDCVAATLALDEFLKATISVVYLLNKTYMPYYKWSFRGMKGFTVLPEVSSMIAELTLAGDTSNAWREPHGANWNPYVNLDDKRVVLIEDICGKVATELRKQGLTSLNDDFLEPYAWDIMTHIEDPVLRSMHVMEG
jgi:hypothetical protein